MVTWLKFLIFYCNNFHEIVIKIWFCFYFPSKSKSFSCKTMHWKLALDCNNKSSFTMKWHFMQMTKISIICVLNGAESVTQCFTTRILQGWIRFVSLFFIYNWSKLWYFIKYDFSNQDLIVKSFGNLWAQITFLIIFLKSIHFKNSVLLFCMIFDCIVFHYFFSADVSWG